LARGADPSIKGAYDMSPLKIASGKDHEDIVELLKKAGAEE